VSTTDASYASGRPGLSIFIGAGGTVGQVQLDNFSANSLTTTNTPPTSRTTLSTKTWNGVADGADIGATFDAGYTGWAPGKIVSQRVLPTTINKDSMESYNAVTPPNDQWCQITIGTIAGAQQAELGCNLRMPNPPTNGWYTCYASRNGGITSEILDFSPGPSIASLASENATTWAAGDKLRCEAQGTTIRLYRIVGTAETLLLSAVSGTHTSGKAGIASLVVTGGTLTNNQISDFAVGQFSTP
jgi:hypothetical protein